MTSIDTIFAQRKLNAAATSIETPKAFLDKFPDLKPVKADKLFRRYLGCVIDALLGKLPFLQEGETYVSAHDLLNACGEFRYKTERYWLWNEFKDIYPLVQVLETGSNIRAANNPFEKNTRVRVVNERFLAMLLEEKSPASIFWHFYTEEDMANAGEVPIDMDNLARFMGNTEIELERATATKHRAKLQGALWQAQLVHKIGQFTAENAGAAVLPLVEAPSAFGRTYYKGMNIQNVGKQVRGAIIGPHYQYDMNAAVFAIKLYLYGVINGGDNELVGTPLGSYTRQYLAEKKMIRERLARSCFNGIDLPWDAKVKAIKNALTAVGFGAKTTGTVWPTDKGMKGTALTEILIAPRAREAFRSDPWVAKFLEEQNVIEDVILAAAERGDNADAMNEAAAASNGANGRATRGGKLSWVYQHEETNLMDKAVAVLAGFGIQPIARIHDAFIVRDRLPPVVLDGISDAWGHRAYLSLDAEEVRGWIDPAFKRALIAADADFVAHRDHMAREEAGAQKKAALKRAGW